MEKAGLVAMSVVRVTSGHRVSNFGSGRVGSWVKIFDPVLLPHFTPFAARCRGEQSVNCHTCRYEKVDRTHRLCSSACLVPF